MLVIVSCAVALMELCRYSRINIVHVCTCRTIPYTGSDLYRQSGCSHTHTHAACTPMQHVHTCSTYIHAARTYMQRVHTCSTHAHVHGRVHTCSTYMNARTHARTLDTFRLGEQRDDDLGPDWMCSHLHSAGDNVLAFRQEAGGAAIAISTAVVAAVD